MGVSLEPSIEITGSMFLSRMEGVSVECFLAPSHPRTLLDVQLVCCEKLAHLQVPPYRCNRLGCHRNE